MERFFCGSSIGELFSRIMWSVKEKIEKMTDHEIMNTDINDWVEYYYSLNEVQPLSVYESNIQPEISNTKIKQANVFADVPGEPQYYLVDGYRLSFKVHYDGYSDLFFMQSNLIIFGNHFYYDSFDVPRDSQPGYFVIHADYLKSNMDKSNVTPDFVKDQFEKTYSDYRDMIKSINTEVRSFNTQLKDNITHWLQARKEHASSLKLLSERLQIPMTLNKNAPNIQPIPLQRAVRKIPEKPQMKKVPQEPYIDDKDYKNINNIIYSCGTAMEKTARSHAHNGEEALRDFLLATLNTHYENASGETFRKNGKTDIHILFENKAAYIAECKIWHGEKLFDDALQQLVSYSTWRDTKVTLIIFNKENRDFNNIISKINKWIKTNTRSHEQIKTNSWNCKYYRTDSLVEIDLHIVVFDLFVEEKRK